MLHVSKTQQHQGNNTINQINKLIFYHLWTYKKILFLLFTLSMTISFSCYNYNNHQKWDTIYLVQFLIEVDIILSKGWSLLQIFISLTYNSSKLDFVDSVWNYYFDNLLSLNFWLFINLFYLVGHWDNWSIRLYHNLFAITGQFDMFFPLLHFPLHGQFDFLFIPTFPIRSIRPE
jgi:hypothetical protein